MLFVHKRENYDSVEERPARAEVLQRARPAAEQVAPGALVLGPRRQREGLCVDGSRRQRGADEGTRGRANCEFAAASVARTSVWSGPGTRGSPSSPPPTSRASSATPRTRRRPCCTGHDLASTRANLASATPRNKSIARINETHLSFCAVYRVPSPSVHSASDTLGPFFWFAGRALAICARSEPETRSGSQQLRKKDEGQLSPTSNGERAAALPRQ